MKRLLMAGGMLAALALAGPASAADGKAVVSANKCASCHKMAGPAAKTIAEVRQRKAPDLFYAGSKFKKEWLEKFLQSPTKLRPAGTVYISPAAAQSSPPPTPARPPNTL
ncbi:MAG: c-type cytochrome [Nitrospinae bacterium]|nr:c-type cytochrome [Nitrospinota bacterium]